MNNTVENLSLEAVLLMGTDMTDENVTQSPGEIVFEMMDIEQEIAQLEMNATTFEAAKAIKKNKSAKKVFKTKTSKMKAKDAKALKATKGKKVLKITKEDEDTGGTGPLPTTSDTNGLTDTDLDAAPEEVVQVIESDDSAEVAAPEDAVGTEGVDFVTEYEDASIMTYEANVKQIAGQVVTRVKEFLKKLGDFIMSVINRIAEFFMGTKKFFEKNKDAITKGLANKEVQDKEVSTVKFDTISASEKIVSDLIKRASDTLASAGSVTGDNSQSLSSDIDDIRTRKTAEILNSTAKAKMKISESGWNVANIAAFLAAWDGKARAEMKDSMNKVRKAQSAVKDANAAAIKTSASVLQKAIALAGKLYSKGASAINVIINTAARAGGAKEEAAKEDAELSIWN